MPTFEISSPDGRTFQVTAPEGATHDQVLAYAQKNYAPAQPMEKPNPTEGHSTLLAGIGKGMASAGRAVGLDGVMRSVWPDLPVDKQEADRLDAPLAATTGGKIGQAIGIGAPVALASFIPGANTYLGATALGGLTGAALTEGGIGDRAMGAGLGVAGGVAGKGVGDAVGAGARWLMGNRASAQAGAQVANAQRDAAAQTAKDAGYVLPPADVKPGLVNEALNGISGKIKTAQVASQRNQDVTNSLVRKELGMAPTDAMNAQALNTIRQQAGKAYQAVEGAGTITPGKTYTDTLDAIVQPYVRAAKSFPNAKPNPIVDEIGALRTASFDAADAVAKIKTLRGEADAAYGAGNKDLGKALKGGADALEQAIDDHLSAFGPSKLLTDFRDARQLIAKTYSVQKGLNDTTGDISAQALAKQLQKGRPLSGELRTVAEVSNAFPKATQSLKEAPKAVSPLDFAVAGMSGTATGNPAMLGMMAARPAIRSLLLSKPYQSLMTKPNYGPGLLMDRGLLPLLQSDAVGRGLLGTGIGSGLLAK